MENLDACHRCGIPPTVCYHSSTEGKQIFAYITCYTCGRTISNLFKNTSNQQLIKSWNSLESHKICDHAQGH